MRTLTSRGILDEYRGDFGSTWMLYSSALRDINPPQHSVLSDVPFILLHSTYKSSQWTPQSPVSLLALVTFGQCDFFSVILLSLLSFGHVQASARDCLHGLEGLLSDDQLFQFPFEACGSGQH